MSSSVNVCEMFASIQGETTRAGQPCFFIRLAGCNLACRYCDTLYARTARGRRRSVSALQAEFRRSRLTLAAVTGGEPLLQPGTPELLRRLAVCGRVLLETNGSFDIRMAPPDTIVIMDIKTPASGEVDAMDWANLGRLRPGDEVKLVISNRADYVWSRDLLAREKLHLKCAAVLLAPAAGILPPARLAQWIMRDRLPVRLNPQLHKILWPGRKRRI